MATLIAVAFSSTDPRTYPSLAPTFLTFKNAVDGSDISKPAISQLSTTGVYTFLYSATVPTYFLLDGITTASTDRYVFGVVDPVQQVDNQLSILSTSLLASASTLAALGTTSVALGTTNVALGTTSVALGTTNVAIGTTTLAGLTLNFALGTTAVALGTTSVALGTTAVAIGTTALAGITLNFALGTTAVAIGTTTLAGLTLNFALGTTNVAIGTSITAQAVTILSYLPTLSAVNATIIGLIGTAASAIGSTSVDPTDLFGYLKRAQEFREGNQTFSKTSGVWSISSRGNTLLATKTLSNSSTTVTKG